MPAILPTLHASNILRQSFYHCNPTTLRPRSQEWLGEGERTTTTCQISNQVISMDVVIACPTPVSPTWSGQMLACLCRKEMLSTPAEWTKNSALADRKKKRRNTDGKRRGVPSTNVIKKKKRQQ